MFLLQLKTTASNKSHYLNSTYSNYKFKGCYLCFAKLKCACMRDFGRFFPLCLTLKVLRNLKLGLCCICVLWLPSNGVL